jgi:hypothetical protein
MSSSHTIEYDYSQRGFGDFDAHGSYTRRWRGINRIGASVVPACKPYNVVAIYGK